MANEENLKKGKATQFRSGEEAARNGKKGGIASGETRRKRKTMRETMELLASQPVTNKGIKKSIKSIVDGIDEDDMDMMLAATMGVFNAAIKGNVSAYEKIVEMLGEGVEDIEDSDTFFQEAGL